MNYNHRLDKVKHHVHHFFGTKALAQLSYHNLIHTEAVVSNAVKIANHYRLEDRETFIVVTSAWFHDTGYSTGEAAGHEKTRRRDGGSEFLRSDEIDDTVIEEVKGCILATIWPQNPENFLQQIMCDADLFHLGTPDFADWNKLVRKEAEQRSGKKMDKSDWRKSTIRLLETHTFQTDYCRDLLDKQKQKNLEKLKEKDLEVGRRRRKKKRRRRLLHCRSKKKAFHFLKWPKAKKAKPTDRTRVSKPCSGSVPITIKG
jgi:predicted metal-dependent HD superfamily phosphohydrolase